MGNKNLKLFLISSIYNESETIEDMVYKINNLIKNKDIDLDIVLVNDASEDNTREILNKIDLKILKVINKEKNEGLSKGILSCLKLINKNFLSERTENRKGVVIKLDMDGEHPIKGIFKLVNDIKIKNFNVSVGMLERPLKIGFFDSLYNKIFGYFQGKYICNKPFSQSSPGFMAYKTEFIPELIEFLEDYQEKYENKYGKKDLIGVDIATLAYLSKNENNIILNKFKTQKIFKNRRPINKIISHGKEFRKHMKLLKKVV